METAEITRNALVKTMDGKALGAVGELRDDAFKINARWRPDYWLSRLDVYEATGDEVQLAFTSDVLNAHKLPKPQRYDGGSDSTYIGY
jgi:hypothetical protein